MPDLPMLLLLGGQTRGDRRLGEVRMWSLGGQAPGAGPVFALARSQAINAHNYQPTNIITT